MRGQTASPAMHGKKAYRGDIDGLRALAILPVVAFHAGIRLAHGGFVGVDVFFVISGYLITQVLAEEIQGNRFSILAFYERRIRRIMPALIAMMVFTLALGLLYSLPTSLIDLFKSAIAATLSVSNVYFWLSSSYFDAPASLKPLLHTWSLAVEEQFYIFWPLYLIVAYRHFRPRLLLITAVIAVVSFVISAYGAFVFPDSTFYLVHTRFWELALGGLLALGALPRQLGSASRNTLSAAGLALIAASVFLIDSDTPFPGAVALPPCLGAALIIHAGRDGDSWVGRLLSWRPIAFIGLISYSLYLWHWPVTVFQKTHAILGGGGSERVGKLLIIGVSMVLAVLSWRYIEQPFRAGRFRPSKRRLLQMAGVSTSLIVAVSAAGWAAGGLPSRYSDKELQVAAYLNYDAAALFRNGRCFLSGRKQGSDFAPECLSVDKTKKNYLLLGDSHAAELWSGLNATFGDINFLQATASGCFPTVEHGLGESPYCNGIIDDVFKRFLADHHIDRVLLVGRWKAGLMEQLSATLDQLKDRGIPVTLIGPTVTYDMPLPQLLINASRSDDPNLPDSRQDHSLKELDGSMASLAAEHKADYVSMFELMCDKGGNCINRNDQGLPLINDREHYTAEGSRLVAQKLKDEGLLK